ncbi:MAG: type II toxin-antitoxin system VapC family toxin [Leucobacter sp.]
MIPEIMRDGILLDSNIAIYALNPDDPRSTACRQFISEVSKGKGQGYASVEMVQEVVFHRLRKTGDRKSSSHDGRALISSLIILDFNYEILDTSLKLVEQLPGMRGRDAVHAATALAYGIPVVASSDPAFDLVPGITRIDPTAAAPKGSRQT